MVQSSGYGQAGRGGTRPTAASSAAAAMRAQQGQYGQGQNGVSRAGPQTQRMGAATMVQGQGARSQQMVSVSAQQVILPSLKMFSMNDICATYGCWADHR